MRTTRGEEGKPRLAVVIPTRERYTRLAFCLDALAGQTAPSRWLEVIVVCDEDDPPPSLLPDPGIPIQVLTTPPRSTPAAKRNAGWEASRAPLVAFTDDDCRPSPGWTEALLSAWEEGDGNTFLNGPVGPDPDERQLLTGLARTLVVTEGQRWYPTANLLFPRSLLEELGGFDPAFRRAGGEDTDLALRAIEGGARPRFVPEAMVWHAVHTRNVVEALQEAARADGVALLFKRHPAQRRRIFARFFWKRSHALALLAGIGILAARRRPALGLLALLPYVRENIDTSVRMTRKHAVANALHLPVRLLVDLAESAATARGALKARTPVL